MKLLAALFLLIPQLAFGFRLDPMVLSLPLAQPNASGTFQVENNSREKIAVQFQVVKRVVDEEGKEDRPPAEGFTIYPDQMALEPGQKRSIRIMWAGSVLPQEEGAYRFIASQLPLDFSQDRAGKSTNLKFLMEYVASLYLVPPKVKAKMKVAKYQVSAKRELELLIENEGSSHYLMHDFDLNVAASGMKLTLDEKRLSEIRSENILPKSKRWIRIPLPKEFPTSNLSVLADFET